MSFLQNIGLTEVIIISVVVLLLFGGKKIPQFVRGLAEAVKEFKKGESK